MTTETRVWPIPAHFDPARAGDAYQVPYERRAAEALAYARDHGIEPAMNDRRRVGLLLVDVQGTFCLPGGELFVAGRGGRGAVEDDVRICEFLYRNLGRITQAIATLDTHLSAQVFHPMFWTSPSGEHPQPYTVVSVEDVERGAWAVDPALGAGLGLASAEERRAFALHYARSLAEGGKYPLTIWPYHALLGGIGHALASVVEEALFFHSVARSVPTRFEPKGSHPLTEHFSALRPEIARDHAGRAIGELNRALLDELLGFDALVVAGQAKSHCLAWTVEDLLREIERRDASLAGRIYLLEDCTSAVVVPGLVDFTDDAERAFRRFAEAGMRIVASTRPMETWPAFERRPPGS